LHSPYIVPGGSRRYGRLLASRYPLRPIVPGLFDVSWPKRVLSAQVFIPGAAVEVHTTHIPPGSTNGWTKIDMLRGLYSGLARPSAIPRILCGDFNTPQAERLGPIVVTWAQRIRPDGTIALCASVRGRPGAAWDEAERSVLLGLAAYDLPDVFRALHGYGIEAFSWVLRRGTRTVPRRFDHIFASASLRPTACAYIHELRECGLSDHAAIEAIFDPPDSGRLTVATRSAPAKALDSPSANTIVYWPVTFSGGRSIAGPRVGHA
jgi:endonuclease/exonuclease/phosphatase family metal-dependent hydrolase